MDSADHALEEATSEQIGAVRSFSIFLEGKTIPIVP